MNIFGMLRGMSAPVEEDDDVKNIFTRIWEPTHIHVRTQKEYMVTSDGERLEVTGDEAYPLVEYEDFDGKMFAQRADRFHDGRFREIA